jgi:hypothetical protein
MSAGVLFVACGLIGLILMTINENGRTSLSGSLQKCIFNYMQVASLFSRFPLRWPASMQGLFDVMGSFSTVGEHLVNPDCASSLAGIGLFYAKQVGFLLLPIILILLARGVWQFYAWKKKIDFSARPTIGMTTPKDKFIVSVGVLLYLVFPTVCSQAFEIFNCKGVTGSGRYLMADMEEQCFVGRHLAFSLGLGLPQLFLYVLGIPLMGLHFLHRNRKKLRQLKVRTRYGLFLSGYKDSKYYWEFTIVVRKVGVVALTVFGTVLRVALQAQLGSLIIIIAIMIQIAGKPYDVYGEGQERYRILVFVELAELVTVWSTLWLGLFMFLLDDTGGELTIKEILTVLTVIINAILLVFMVVAMLREKIYENENSRLGKKIAEHINKRRTRRRTDADVPKKKKNKKKKKGKTRTSSIELTEVGVNVAWMAGQEWKRHYDEDSDRWYVVNSQTGEKRWERMDEAAAQRSFVGKSKRHKNRRQTTGVPEADTDAAIKRRKKVARLSMIKLNKAKRKSVSNKSVTKKRDDSAVNGPHHRSTSTRLPPGWHKFFDDKYQQKYYVNKESGLSSWTAPEGSKGGSAEPQHSSSSDSSGSSSSSSSSSSPSSDSSSNSSASSDSDSAAESGDNVASGTPSRHRSSSTRLPSGWVKFFDQITGQGYYSHKGTGESVWSPPNGSSGGSSGVSERQAHHKNKSRSGSGTWFRKRSRSKMKKKSDNSWRMKTDSAPAEMLSNPMRSSTVVANSAATSAASSSADISSHRRDSTNLPNGWQKFATGEGKKYYAERLSGTSSWTPPPGSTGGSATQLAKAAIALVPDEKTAATKKKPKRAEPSIWTTKMLHAAVFNGTGAAYEAALERSTRAFFERCDKNQNREISRAEFLDEMSAQSRGFVKQKHHVRGMSWFENAPYELFDAIDVDKSGTIEEDELVGYVRKSGDRMLKELLIRQNTADFDLLNAQKQEQDGLDFWANVKRAGNQNNKNNKNNKRTKKAKKKDKETPATAAASTANRQRFQEKVAFAPQSETRKQQLLQKKKEMKEKIRRLERQKQAAAAAEETTELSPVSATVLRKEQLLEKKRMMELKLEQLAQKQAK